MGFSWAKIQSFLFDIKSEQGTTLLQSKIQVAALYAILGISAIAIPQNVIQDLADGASVLAYGQIMFSILLVLGLIMFWATRSPRITRMVFASAVVVMCTLIVVQGGGSRGFGYLYFMAGYPILFFVLGLQGGIILPLAYFLGILFRIQAEGFPPLSVFNNPDLSQRLLAVMGISTLVGVTAVLFQSYLIKTMAKSAYIDTQTGLANRSNLEDKIAEWLNSTLSPSIGFSIIGIKLNNFDRINTSQGTTRGDLVLKEIARRIQALTPKSGICGRYSGTGFLLITRDLDHGSLEKLAHTLVTSIEVPIVIEGGAIQTRASIAITQSPSDGTTVEKLMANILATHGRKYSQGLSVLFFDEEQFKTDQEFWLITEALQKALQRNEFSLVYQPKINLRSKEVVGLEVLLRWNSRTLGSISPDVFIPIAEQNNMISPISQWVLKQAILELSEADLLPSKGNLIIAINISPLDLVDAEFRETLSILIEKNVINPNAMEFEVTEGVLMSDDPRVDRNLEALREMGFRIAIDDFGTGYSSLSYLHHMRINNLKIDKSFIREMTTGPARAKVVEAIIRMGEALDLEITAEGVESNSEALLLKSLGCTTGQGWLWAKAMPLDQLQPWLRDRGQVPSLQLP